MIAFLLESAVRSLGLGIVVWIALTLLRTRNPQSRSLAWTAVLLTALAMPVLMPLMEVVMTSAPAAAQWMPAAPPSLHLRPLDPSIGTAPGSPSWLTILSSVYVAIAAAFLFRLVVGLMKSRRLCRAAIPLTESWTSGNDVRVSATIGIPATIGSTILFPADWPQWSEFKRRAVFLHEQAHVRRGDFYIYLLAGVHRAIFWFNPLAWWIQKELVEFTEAACDDEAIQNVSDRAAYAEALVELAARGAGSRFVGLAMARGRTVANRVERILRETAVAPKASFLGRVLLVVAFLPLAGFAAGSWLVEAKIITALPLPRPQAPAPQPPPAVPPQQPAARPAQAAQPIPATPPILASQYLAVWPEQEVPDIIDDREREAFRGLRSDEEREQFITQFWLRRDPTPGTVDNEFRDGYYQRIANANERFTTRFGVPGWRTDRGRILTRHGEPDEIVTEAQGGTYLRRDSEGGRRTSTFPFEQWRYRFIEGVGNNIILEFVDTERNGSYRLAFDPGEGTKGVLNGVPSR